MHQYSDTVVFKLFPWVDFGNVLVAPTLKTSLLLPQIKSSPPAPHKLPDQLPPPPSKKKLGQLILL